MVLETLIALCCGWSTTGIQSPKLTIGSPAPQISGDAWIKGNPVPQCQNGKVYVVEFWATWCGPCIDAFPKISELADQMRDQATFISVNSWDYTGAQKSESKQAHANRIQAFVKSKDAIMRTNILLDDSKDSMAKRWMSGIGKDTIPCSFIVDQETKIVWVGHPEDIEEPLKAVIGKRWDVQSFKVAFERERQAKERKEAIKKQIGVASRANDLKAFDLLLHQLDDHESIYAAIAANPAFGLKVIETYRGKLASIRPTLWCAMCADAGERASQPQVKAKAVKVCEDSLAQVPKDQRVVGMIYLARCHYANGNSALAHQMLNQAKEIVSTFEPASQRPALEMYIRQTEEKIKP